MKQSTLGEMIRDLRKRAGLSQEDLAEDICSVVTVSRVENDTQMPTETVLTRLLERLGTSTYQLCNVYYRNERQDAFEKRAQEISDILESDTDKLDFKEVKKKISALKKEAGDDPYMLQTYAHLCAAYDIQKLQQPVATGTRSVNTDKAKDIVKKLKEALAFTKPGFDYDDFRNVLLSVNEVSVLQTMTVALYHSGDTGSAIRLGEELLHTLNAHESEISGYTSMKSALIFDLAACMEDEGRYRDQLRYCEMAEELLQKEGGHFSLPLIEYMKARAYHELGDDKKSADILKAIAPYMELIGETYYAARVKKYANDVLKKKL